MGKVPFTRKAAISSNGKRLRVGDKVRSADPLMIEAYGDNRAVSEVSAIGKTDQFKGYICIAGKMGWRPASAYEKVKR